jgi:hypothetical protein
MIRSAQRCLQEQALCQAALCADALTGARLLGTELLLPVRKDKNRCTVTGNVRVSALLFINYGILKFEHGKKKKNTLIT